MSYKVTVVNKYSSDNSILKLAFDTNSVLLHDAYVDTDVEVFGARMNQGKNPFEKPIFSRVTYKPTVGVPTND